MSNCPQVHQALLTTAFNGTDQTLTIIQGIAILSLLADEEFGVENLGHALAQTSERDFWVGFSAALHESADALLTLSSIAADNTLPKPERLRNNRSYASFIARPNKLRWAGVKQLLIDYKVILDSSPSGDPRLPELKFSECANNSFYIKVDLTSDADKSPRFLIIRLGSENDDFKSGCSLASLSTSNIILDTKPRVDASSLGQPKLMSVGDSQKRYGDLYIRSISVVVDRGTPQTNANYKVRLYRAMVNDVALSDRPRTINAHHKAMMKRSAEQR